MELAMGVFSTIILADDELAARQLHELAQASGVLDVLKTVTPMPTGYQLARLVGTFEPAVVLTDLQTSNHVFEIGAEIRKRTPKTVLFGMNAHPGHIALAQQAGYSALLPPGSTPEDLRLELREAVHRILGGVEQNLYCFIPSKAGSGASSIVFNTACASARDRQKKVLVIDADLRSGVQALLLNSTTGGSVENLLAQAPSIDTFLWESCVVRAHNVEWLLSNRRLDMPLPAWEHWYQVINFARERYDIMLVDLPEVVNDASVEMVRRARLVFTVATPEVLSLKLTQQRFAELKRWQIADERVTLILNRHHPSDPDPQQIGATVGKPVFRAIPNHYPSLREAILNGAPVPSTGKLGKHFSDLAGALDSSGPTTAQPVPGGWTSKLRGLLKMPA
jgi:pilus assembly protein CpaE